MVALVDAIVAVLDGPLDGAIRGAPKVSFSDLHKDVQESAFEVPPKISL